MIMGLSTSEAEQVIAYAFRITDERPANVSEFEVNADRVRGFVDRWLDRKRARCVDMTKIHVDPGNAERIVARVRKEPEFIMQEIDKLR